MHARHFVTLIALFSLLSACKRGSASSSGGSTMGALNGSKPANAGNANALTAAAQATCARYRGSLAATASRSAYPTAIVQPPGQPWSYIAWVWRETPDVSTEHTVSVARTTDLINWTDTCGAPVSLPLTLQNTEVVDPVPVQGGLLNNEVLSYDSQGRMVITYTKYVSQDGNATSQVFNARRDPDGWKLFQMTQWSTAQVLSGGGSLPITPLSIGFGGIQIDANGMMFQTFSRAAADKVGTPAAGTYAITTDANGVMVRGSPYQAPVLSPSAFAWTPPAAAAALALDPRTVTLATPFTIHMLPSRYQSRWISLRGDWNGSGQNGAGLYDAFMSTFYIWSAGSAVNAFAFGAPAATVQYQPMAGDWQHTGKAGVGIYAASSNTSYLKNTLTSGPASSALTGQPTVSQGLVDAPWLWHTWDPAKQTFIRWEALPPNRDFPYDCAGQPLSDQNQIAVAPTTCPQNFISNLTMWAFDQTTGSWSSSVIDQQWGGSPADFDFLTFKNYQIVVYYNASRYLTLATRPLGGAWTIQATNSQFAGWDGHNSLTVEVDANDDIHVSGNMHHVPLNYFRSTGLNAANLTRAPMVGKLEDEVTYPSFFYTPQGMFGFSYREGVSGDGDTYLNAYDIATKSWRRLVSQPLFAGTSSSP